jgi:peptidoglycan/LPS O-acetylase OafA/YrhL
MACPVVYRLVAHSTGGTAPKIGTVIIRKRHCLILPAVECSESARAPGPCARSPVNFAPAQPLSPQPNAAPPFAANNFDLLRLLLAVSVCLSHVYALSGFPALSGLERIFSATLAVKAFFVVSGFLIFMSYERSSSWYTYARKRLRRIYPAYFTVIVLSALLLFAISRESFTAYFSSAWLKYLAANLLFMNFLQPTLPGVFTENALTAVNGALWTLKIEVMFYLSVPLLAWLFRRFARLPLLIFFYVGSVAYAALCAHWATQTGMALYAELGRQLPGQLAYFLAGAAGYYYLPLFQRHRPLLLVAGLALLGVNAYLPLPLLEPLALAGVLIFFAVFAQLGDWGRNWGRYGDFSYGIYIVHFPVIQTLLQLGWFADAPGLFLLAAVTSTTLTAIALWHLVEKRFLLRDSHYLAATQPDTPAGSR